MKNSSIIIFSLCCFITINSYSAQEPRKKRPQVVVHNDNRQQFLQTIATDGNSLRTTTKTLSGISDTPYRDVALSTNSLSPIDSNKQRNKPSVAVVNSNHHSVSQQAHVSRTLLDPEIDIEEIIGSPSMTAQNSLKGSFLTRFFNFAGRGTYIMSGIALTYGTILAKLFYGAYALANNQTWSSWRKDVPLAALSNVEQQVAQELFSTIQTHYANAPTSACFLSPLVHFINDVDAELVQLHSFVKIHAWIEYLKLSSFFPKQEDEQRTALEKIKRLEFIKQALINWVGEYKVPSRTRL